MCIKGSAFLLCIFSTSMIVYQQICNVAVQRFMHAYAHADAQDFQSLEQKLKPFIPRSSSIFPMNIRPNITLSVQGGGWKNSYSMGALYVLNKAEVSIQKAAGASTGSWVAYASLTSTDKLKQWYNACKAYYHSFNGHAANYEMFKYFLNFFATEEVLYESLEVSTANLALPLVQGEMESEFTSPEDVRMALIASASIPFYSTRGNLPFLWHAGKLYVDGGIWDNEPVHSDFAKHTLIALRPNVVTDMSDVFLMSQKRAEELIIRGARDMANVLDAISKGSTEAQVGGITWVDQPTESRIQYSHGRSALNPRTFI